MGTCPFVRLHVLFAVTASASRPLAATVIPSPQLQSSQLGRFPHAHGGVHLAVCKQWVREWACTSLCSAYAATALLLQVSLAESN